jgi:hypothetical protein
MRSTLRLLVFALLLSTVSLSFADPLPVQHPQGTLHGFVVLRSETGAVLGYGEITQVVAGERVTAHVVYRFSDGSVDEETTIFTQNKTFQLVSDRHTQRGPFFAKPADIQIEANGQITTRTTGKDGKSKVEVEHLDLPQDISSIAMMATLLLNVHPGAPAFQLGMVLPAGKGRLIKLDIAPDGQSPFTIAGAPRKASLFRIKLELGGVAGAAAPVVGKQPADIVVWVLEGEAPLLVREVGQLSEDGPIVSVELPGAAFPKNAAPAK